MGGALFSRLITLSFLTFRQLIYLISDVENLMEQKWKGGVFIENPDTLFLELSLICHYLLLIFLTQSVLRSHQSEVLSVRM